MAFTRQRHQYRNAKTIIGKFTAGGGATSTFTRVSGTSEVSSNKMSLSNLAASLTTLTFEKARLATVLHAYITVPTPSATLQKYIAVNAEPNAAAGTVVFRLLDNADADIAAGLAAGSIVTIVMQLAQ